MSKVLWISESVFQRFSTKDSGGGAETDFQNLSCHPPCFGSPDLKEKVVLPVIVTWAR